MLGGRRPVVVGIDNSARAGVLVAHAVWEAHRRAVPLRLVHGFEFPVLYAGGPGPIYDQDVLLVDAEHRLNELAVAAMQRYPDLEVSTRLIAGPGLPLLVDESRSAALVLVGPPTRGRLPRFPLTSVSRQLALRAHAPVIVVRGPDPDTAPGRPRSGPVVVGVDGSTSSQAALDFGFEEASARRGELIGLHVSTAFAPGGLDTGHEWSEDPGTAYVQQRDEAERMLAEAMAGWQEKYPGVLVRRWVRHGTGTADILLEAADDVAAGLVVIGRHGHGGWGGLALGSVCAHVVARASRSVAVVHLAAGP